MHQGGKNGAVCGRRGHKIRGGICSVSVTPARAGGVWGWLWGAHRPPKPALQRPWGPHTPIAPSCPGLAGGELGQPGCCYLHQEHQDVPFLVPPHRWPRIGRNLHFPPLASPLQLTPPIAMETWGDAEQGDAARLGGSRSRKGSCRRRCDVVRLGTSAGVSPGPSPCTEAEDKHWLTLPIPLTTHWVRGASYCLQRILRFSSLHQS